MSKFIQIATSDSTEQNYLFALDDEGIIWSLEGGKWIELVHNSAPNQPTKANKGEDNGRYATKIWRANIRVV